MLDDPLSLLSVCVWTLAAGMYPLGLMLGSECSPCCGCKCEDGETLPDMLEVTFSDIPEDYECCATLWNGATVRLTREGESCYFTKNCCGNIVTLQYRGTSTTPLVTISGKCDIVFEAEASGVPFECQSLTFDAFEPLGGKASIADNVNILTEGGDPLVGESGEDLKSEIDNPLCPPCCVGLPSEFNDDACTQETCEAAGGTWFSHCECVGCDPGSCEGLELIVEVEGTCARNGNSVTKNYTATLNAANGFSEYIDDPDDPDGDTIESGCTVSYGPTVYPSGCGVFVQLNIVRQSLFGIYVCVLYTRSYGIPAEDILPFGPPVKCGAVDSFPLPADASLCPISGGEQDCDQNWDWADLGKTSKRWTTKTMLVTVTLVT